MSFLRHVLLEMIIKIAEDEALGSKNNNKKEMFLSEETLKSKKSHLVEIMRQSLNPSHVKLNFHIK